MEGCLGAYLFLLLFWSVFTVGILYGIYTVIKFVIIWIKEVRNNAIR